MSIVAVHGPTMGGTGTGNITAPQVAATGDATNGLKFTFVASTPGARPAADFSWAFPPDGTPATAAATKGPVAVTYGAAGSKTATLTVAAGAGPPAGGTYPVVVNAVSGPRSVEE